MSYILDKDGLIWASTDNGGNTPAALERVFGFNRRGRAGESNSNVLQFLFGRYEDNLSNARSALDINMRHDAEAAPYINILSLRSSGRVGLGKTAPDYRLHVNGTLGLAPGAAVTPVSNGDVVFELTGNTTLTIKAKGSDGVVRSVALTLA